MGVEKDASYYLNEASRIMQLRGKERDLEKERSMIRIVSTFNALTGFKLSIIDGWLFMVILKLVRIRIKPNEDSFIDMIAYGALMSEEFEKETTDGS